MVWDSDKIVNILVGAFITVILFGVFFPMVQTEIGNLSLNAVVLFGTTYDFSWVGYLIILGLLFLLVAPAIKGLKLGKGKK